MGTVGSALDEGVVFGRSQVVDDLDACAAERAATLLDDLDAVGVVHLRSLAPASPASIDLLARALGLGAPPHRTTPTSMPGHEYLAVFRSPERTGPRDPSRPRREPAYPTLLHQDSYGRTLPPYALIVAESVPGGPPMVLVDLAQAHDTLEPVLLSQIEGRRARHGRLPPPSEPLSSAPPYDPERAYVHPLVVAHPRTGRRLLHLPRHPESTVEGLSDGEGRELLGALWQHVETTDARVEMPHESHDVIVWDNLRCLHVNPRASGGAAREVWFTLLGEAVTPSA
jgi:alpha-ketoglutarate-dependent taurine dioxygenase